MLPTRRGRKRTSRNIHLSENKIDVKYSKLTMRSISSWAGYEKYPLSCTLLALEKMGFSPKKQTIKYYMYGKNKYNFDIQTHTKLIEIFNSCCFIVFDENTKEQKKYLKFLKKELDIEKKVLILLKNVVQ